MYATVQVPRSFATSTSNPCVSASGTLGQNATDAPAAHWITATTDPPVPSVIVTISTPAGGEDTNTATNRHGPDLIVALSAVRTAQPTAMLTSNPRDCYCTHSVLSGGPRGPKGAEDLLPHSKPSEGGAASEACLRVPLSGGASPRPTQRRRVSASHSAEAAPPGVGDPPNRPAPA